VHGLTASRIVPLRLLRLALTIILLLILTACGGMNAEPRIVTTLTPRPTLAPTPVSDVPASLSQSPDAVMFRQYCGACHGDRGRGDGPSVTGGAIPYVPDFTRPETFAGRGEDEVYQIITDGRLDRFMPPWGGVLSEDDRRMLARYVLSLSVTPMPEGAATEVSRRGE
jgi:mono/diheme cytochrome c family protein